MTYKVAVCLRDAPGSDMIGVGGCYRLDSGVYGWPVIGYMFRREVWGRGIATEFLEAWLGMWRELPREEREVLVHPASVVMSEAGKAEEVVTAFLVEGNAASRRVLEKCGFEKFHARREADLRDPKMEVELVGFRHVVGGGGLVPKATVTAEHLPQTYR
jgi:RimJ/RimL family protein N-acetyltransferase